MAQPPVHIDGLLRRARALGRNAPLAASVAIRQLRDDPVNAAVLASRLVPPRAKEPVRRALLRLTDGGEAPAGRFPALRSLVLWDRGERERAIDTLVAATKTARPRTLRRLAALAVALDAADAAERVLETLPPTDPARPRLAALTAWRRGQLTEAVEIVDRPVDGPTAGSASAAARGERTRRRLAGELAALSPGWTPTTGLTARRLDPVRGRVLHVVTNSLPYKNAGYTVRTQEIALAQRRRGLDPHVVTRLGFPVVQGSFDAATIDVVDGVPYHRLLPRGALPREADAFLTRNVDFAGRLVERLRPAMLHAASNHVNGQIALALRDRYGLPVVYEVRGFLEETWRSRHGDEGADSDRYLRGRELETHCMRGADAVVTLGEVMKAEIAERGVDAERILVVPNAVDESFLAPPPEPGPVRAALGIRDDEVTVGLVSSFVGYEGIDTLVRAAALLRDRKAPLRLLLVGDGAERGALERLVEDLDLRRTAVFTGRVPFCDVRAYYAALDVFVVPRIDARVCHLVTPLKPIEAMASGRPVVASAVAGLAEVIEDGRTGVLVTPEDPARLADAVEPLLYDADLRDRLGQAARDWVARHRTWTEAAKRYVTAYRLLDPT